MANQTCFVSAIGWLCIRLGQHSIPVFKLNDAQEREWRDANKFVSTKQEVVHRDAAAFEALDSMVALFMAENPLQVQPDTDAVPVTLRYHSNIREYNLPLNKNVIATLNNAVSLSAATAYLHCDFDMPLHVCTVVIQWLAFYGFIDDKIVDEYNRDEFSKVVIIPQDYRS
jgi:hypothetical protein